MTLVERTEGLQPAQGEDRRGYDSYLKVHEELSSGIGTDYVLCDSGGWSCGQSEVMP